jgi:hypothetical protein
VDLFAVIETMSEQIKPYFIELFIPSQPISFSTIQKAVDFQKIREERLKIVKCLEDCFRLETTDLLDKKPNN